MITVGVKIPKEIWNLLELVAKGHGITVEHVIRNIIKEQLKNEELQYDFVRKSIKVENEIYWKLRKIKNEHCISFADVINVILIKWLLELYWGC